MTTPTPQPTPDLRRPALDILDTVPRGDPNVILSSAEQILRAGVTTVEFATYLHGWIDAAQLLGADAERAKGLRARVLRITRAYMVAP